MKPRGGEHPLTVAVRVRPMNEEEIMAGGTQIAHPVDKQMVVLLDPTEDPDDILRANRSRERRYVFDKAFDETSDQEEVYQETTRFLVDQVLNGYNGTVFAYGATGAGKTHTMLGTQHNPGIYSRALNDLFHLVEKFEEENIYNVSMSYLEIYNEMIRDLLNPSTGYLEMREDAKGGVQVANLSEISTASTQEIMELLQQGNLERTQEPTKANKTSSRSHAVLQITVKQRSRARGVDSQVKIGKLFLVDLAGSERAANTQNRGKRMVEGAHINRSLLALGNCITALSESSDKGVRTYVNFRDSKLTRLLKDALGGNCKTVMIAHLGPASFHFEESRNTLLYADRAKRIKNKVRRNVEDVSYHIAQYTQIISELRSEIERLRAKVSQSITQPANIQSIQNEVLRSSNDQEFFKLKEQLMMTFKEQMELRRSVMELSNASMEISLESSRHALTLSEWEADQVKRKEQIASGDTNVDLEAEEEPEEVKIAREELKVLMSEKKKTDKLNSNVSKELEITRQKAATLEENIPKYVSTEFQKEMLSLLLRVHELEIQNIEYQSRCYFRENELSQKDFIISKYQNYRSLAEEIISQQRDLLSENKIFLPHELEEYLDMFQQEQQLLDEGIGHQKQILPTIKGSVTSLVETSASTINLDRLSTLAEESPSRFASGLSHQHTANRQSPDPRDDSNKVFSLTQKSLSVKNGGTSIPRYLTVSPLKLKNKEDTLYTISMRSNSIDSIDKKDSPLQFAKTKYDVNRPKINQETRGIAALAAAKRRRQQQQYDATRLGVADNHLNRTFISNNGDDMDSRLTPSRLATHNLRYGSRSNLNDNDSITADQKSSHTEPTYSYQGGENHQFKPRGKIPRATKYRPQPLAKVPNASSSNSEKTSEIPSKNIRHPKKLPVRGKQAGVSWKVKDTQSQVTKPKTNKVTSRYLQSFGNSSTNNDKQPYKIKGNNTNSKENKKSKTKKAQSHPTIPSYQKGDITVAGFSLNY